MLGIDGFGAFGDDIVLFNDGSGDFTHRPRYVLPQRLQRSVAAFVPLDINRDGARI